MKKRFLLIVILVAASPAAFSISLSAFRSDT